MGLYYEHLNDNTRDNIRNALLKSYENDPNTIKQIDDICNNIEYDKLCNEYIKKGKIDMTDETKTTEQTTDQIETDDTTKKTVNPFDYEHLADILWNASIKHPFIAFGLVSGVLMLGGIKLTKHIISCGVYMGNMKTLKTIYHITH